jgi:hypothetical protein
MYFIGEQHKNLVFTIYKNRNRVLISHNVNIHDNISHSLNSEIRHQEFLYSYKYHKPMPNKDLLAEEIIIGTMFGLGLMLQF